MSVVTKIAIGITAVSLTLGANLSYAGSSFDANGQKKAGKTLDQCKKAAQAESVTYPANATVKDGKRREWQAACDKAYKK